MLPIGYIALPQGAFINQQHLCPSPSFSSLAEASLQGLGEHYNKAKAEAAKQPMPKCWN